TTILCPVTQIVDSTGRCRHPINARAITKVIGNGVGSDAGHNGRSLRIDRNKGAGQRTGTIPDKSVAYLVWTEHVRIHAGWTASKIIVQVIVVGPLLYPLPNGRAAGFAVAGIYLSIHPLAMGHTVCKHHKVIVVD